jgi:hypothetical protein
MRRLARRLTLAFLPVFIPTVASAHAFGQQFTLPLPVSYYLFGGTAAFLVSACIILLFSEPHADATRPPLTLFRYRRPERVARMLRALGLVALLTELAFCFFGAPSYFENPSIVLFWIMLLLGLTYFSVFLGGIWEALNPFKTLARYLSPGLSLRYPAWLSYWPSVVLFFFLICLELYGSSIASEPTMLGALLLLYATLMLLGSAIYGVEPWFAHADVFGVFFRVVSLPAPLTLTDSGIERTAPGARLIRERPGHMSLVVFILFMLSATAFDGIRETRVWWDSYERVHTLVPALTPDTFGITALLISPVLFFALYAVAIWLMRVLSRKGCAFPYLLLRFGYSLIPIAIAYHFAHYFALLLGEGQRLIYQASDPFGRGWDLFGTNEYTPNLVLFGSDTVWYIQLSTIVLGHVLAAFIAHRIAAREFATAGVIAKSQLPMLILMVGYTALGLWILSRAFVT